MSWTPLDELCSLDTQREILAAMTPGQLAVAALRIEGLTDGEIGDLFGMTRQAVSHRMRSAQRRIARQSPELRLLLGRHRWRGWESERGR